MKVLKSLFVQRFSAFDIIVLGSVLTTVDLSIVALIAVVAVWTIISVVAERQLDLRHKNGNTPWEEL